MPSAPSSIPTSCGAAGDQDCHCETLHTAGRDSENQASIPMNVAVAALQVNAEAAIELPDFLSTLPALALCFLRFVLRLARWIARLACNRVRVDAIQPRRALYCVRNVFHLRALSDEWFEVSVKLALAWFFGRCADCRASQNPRKD